MPFIAHPFDMFIWYITVQEILERGISVSTFNINPAWNLLLILQAHIYGYLSDILKISVINISDLPQNFNPSYNITIVTDPLFNILIKIPFIIADLFTTIIIYKLSYFYSRDFSISRTSALLYLFSPIVIWISAGWGQYDSLAVFFTMLSLYFFFVLKKINYSSISLFIAVLIKIYPIIFFVPIIISIWKFDENRLKKIVSFLFIPLFFASYIIFFQYKMFLSFINNLLFPTGFFFSSGFGLTYWSISLIFPFNNLLQNIIKISLLLLFSYIAISFIIKKANTLFEGTIIGSFVFISGFFLSFTIITEQRVLILLALLSLIILRYPNLKAYSFVLSTLALLYAQKNFPFYLLPLASKFPDSFSFLFSSFSQFVNRSSNYILPTSIGSYILFLIGISFSIVLFMLLLKIFNLNRSLPIKKI